ncbi:hypothetical protein AGLY_004712 [Aphis glycines]|uniref:Uncharacterized protein n=1 Tax=Aphis glycines TaxID=307491 RepID=A0A6G0TV60_APHGL|nr:hypothetical protein AGLY_004712 [Aphis glycines]
MIEFLIRSSGGIQYIFTLLGYKSISQESKGVIWYTRVCITCGRIDINIDVWVTNVGEEYSKYRSVEKRCYNKLINTNNNNPLTFRSLSSSSSSSSSLTSTVASFSNPARCFLLNMLPKVNPSAALSVRGCQRLKAASFRLAETWVPFCCTIGGGVDLGLGIYDLYFLNNNKYLKSLGINRCRYDISYLKENLWKT